MANTLKIPSDLSLKCGDCPIRHRAVCSRCEPDELAVLEQIKFYQTFAPNQTITIRGDAMNTVSSVVKGTATLTRVMEDGRVQMVGLLLPSDFIGRPGRETMGYDVTAVSEVVLCSFQRKPFENLVYETPHIGQRVMEMALDELDAARDWMLLLGRKTAREKVASFLILVLQRTVADKLLLFQPNQTIELPITRDVMSTYLGLTIETVSRQMNALYKDGIIATEGKRRVIIKDVETLMIEAGNDTDGTELS